MTAPTLRERARKAALDRNPGTRVVYENLIVAWGDGYISGSLDTMRECAKLVCGYCPDPHMNRAAMDVYTHLDMVDGETVCLASAIYAAIAEAEAEREEK